MYIIAYRTHFCLLLGLGKVGHPPRETSGSDGTLNRGPCLALVRLVTPQEEPVGVLGPWTESQCGWAPSPPAAPCPLKPLLAPNAPLRPPLPYKPSIPPNAPVPLLSPRPLHSLQGPNAALRPLYPF